MRLLAAHQDTRSFLDTPTELLPAVRGEEHFPGTGRFRVMRRLGAGGMGVVYEVHDRVRDEVVALKTLLGTSAADLYRLKREFRSLADVAHPNLVCLYELFVEDDRCFFTMELVRGVSFVDYARRGSRLPFRRSTGRRASAARRRRVGAASARQASSRHQAVQRAGDARRTRRDPRLRPDRRAVCRSTAGDVSYVSGGTPAYMSPEEASGAPPSEAERLVRRRRHALRSADRKRSRSPVRSSTCCCRKRADDPPAPAEVVPDVPADLSAICMGLLCRDPDERLSGPEALRRLARDTAPPVAGRRTGADSRRAIRRPRPSASRVERRLPRRSSTGGAAAVSVYGPSGIGKSALVRRFLGQLGTRDDVVVLSGRCYENESVPYKALDGVVDDLSRHLASIPRQQVERLLPPDVPALTRVFPVLLQVDAIADARRRSGARERRSAWPPAAGLRGAARAAAPAGGSPVRWSSASTTCNGPTPTARSCSRSCCGLRARPPCSRCCASAARKRPRSRFSRRCSSGPGATRGRRSRSSR